jgi:hypothetical protein
VRKQAIIRVLYVRRRCTAMLFCLSSGIEGNDVQGCFFPSGPNCLR